MTHRFQEQQLVRQVGDSETLIIDQLIKVKQTLEEGYILISTISNDTSYIADDQLEPSE